LNARGSCDDAGSKDDFLRLEGARLHFRDEGRGPVIMLLHGWALDLEMWEPQVDAWRDTFRIVRFDRRGFGASSGTPSLAADARDVQALAEHLGLTRFALLGMSQGGRVALQVATSAFASRLTCLILDGAPGERTSEQDMAPEEIPLAHYRELARREGLDAFRREWSSHPFAQLHSASEDERELLRRITARFPAVDLLSPVRGVSAPAETPEVRSLRIATLVVNGELDTERRRAMGLALTGSIPDARRVVIRGSGHLPNLDNPHEYNAVVRRFLEQH
jgi:pimeloyl-ACP methyl ester carboxylesterase